MRSDDLHRKCARDSFSVKCMSGTGQPKYILSSRILGGMLESHIDAFLSEVLFALCHQLVYLFFCQN